MKTLISDISRCSFVDGPGIRTTVFLKGCPLSCMWCHNPETISATKEQIRKKEICSLCLNCLMTCQSNAISYDGAFHYNPSRCIDCGKCENECPCQALHLVGHEWDVQLLVEFLLRDKVYYAVSGGGVTFSGGEPLIHIDFLSRVCDSLKKEGIHIAIQTAGFFDYEEFSAKLEHLVDLIYYDLKIADSDQHKRFTGRKNDRIMHNLAQLAKNSQNKIIVRTPLIPGISDNDENIRQISEIVEVLKLSGHELIPFNPAGKVHSKASVSLTN